MTRRGVATWRDAVSAALLIGLRLAMPAAAHADDAGGLAPPDRQAIEQVIRNQLDAFRRDDAAGAYALASPGIQALFGDADHFIAMVRQGYQPVYRPRHTQFGDLESAGGSIVQHVELVGPDGTTRTALYTMEHEPDGSWRIGGCVLLDSGSVGA